MKFFVRVIAFLLPLSGFVLQAHASCTGTVTCRVDATNPLKHCIKCMNGQAVEDTQCRRLSIDVPSDTELEQAARVGLARKCGMVVHPSEQILERR